MKKSVLLAVFMACCALGLMAQGKGGYVITELVSYDEVKLTEALDKCRFDSYRKMNERVTLTFKDGSTIELLSVKEMQQLGFACDVTSITPATHQQNNVFILHPDGYVVEEVRNEPNSLKHQKQQLLENPKTGKP